MLSSLPGWLITILFLGTLIFIHEFGHFLVARVARVQVAEFGVGYPPRLLKLFRQGGTVFTLNAIPFGGFVRLAGEDDPKVAGGFASAGRGIRAAVLLGGVAANLLAALIVFTVGFKIGWPDRVAVASIAPGSPALAAGLEAGDVILRADGQVIHQPEDLSALTYGNLGKPILLEVGRGSGRLRLTVTPRTSWPANQGPMGIEMQAQVVNNYSWPQALQRSGETIGQQTLLIVTLPIKLIQGQIAPDQARPVGVIGIYDLTVRTVQTAQQTDQWVILLQWAGLISTALALGNLLPIPALDGGRLLFVVIETVRGRRVSPEREQAVHAIGFVLLVGLMIYISYLDLVHPILPR
jgi:regulator of sigma E protease